MNQSKELSVKFTYPRTTGLLVQNKHVSVFILEVTVIFTVVK